MGVGVTFSSTNSSKSVEKTHIHLANRKESRKSVNRYSIVWAVVEHPPHPQRSERDASGQQLHQHRQQQQPHSSRVPLREAALTTSVIYQPVYIQNFHQQQQQLRCYRTQFFVVFLHSYYVRRRGVIDTSMSVTVLGKMVGGGSTPPPLVTRTESETPY